MDYFFNHMDLSTIGGIADAILYAILVVIGVAYYAFQIPILDVVLVTVIISLYLVVTGKA